VEVCEGREQCILCCSIPVQACSYPPATAGLQAAKFVALAGSRPLEPLLTLETGELLHTDNYFTGPPDRASVHAEVDSLHM